MPLSTLYACFDRRWSASSYLQHWELGTDILRVSYQHTSAQCRVEVPAFGSTVMCRESNWVRWSQSQGRSVVVDMSL